MNDILHEFERLGRTCAESPFVYIQRGALQRTYSFSQLNLAAAAVARELGVRGAKPGSTVACSLYNGPELVLTVLAALYGGFDLALLNPRDTEAERAKALSQLDLALPVLEEADYPRLVLETVGVRLRELASQSSTRVSMAYQALELDAYVAERLSDFDVEGCGIVLFSAEGAAVRLPWSRLGASAQDANQQLGAKEGTVWQLVLPLCHVDGFQVLVRSLLNGNSFVLYTNYVVQDILNDVLPLKATHISVVEPILLDLLLNDRDAVLSQYQCILVGGPEPGRDVLRRASRAGAQVRVSHPKSAPVGADLIDNGHLLGLDCSYDSVYLGDIANN